MQEPEDHLVPTGQCRILLQSGRSWSGTPLLLSTRVCVVQIGWRQWWHSQSCGWLVFPRLQHSHPSRGQIWGRDAEWACSEILISGKVKRRRAGAFQRPLTGWLKWIDTFYIIFFSDIFPCIPHEDTTIIFTTFFFSFCPASQTESERMKSSDVWLLKMNINLISNWTPIHFPSIN